MKFTVSLGEKLDVSYDSFRIIRYRVIVQPAVIEMNKMLIGIDPGQVNMGMAFVGKDHADLYQIGLPSDSDPAIRIMNVAEVVSSLLEVWRPQLDDRACIEYAAYNKLHGQVPLAEARTSAGIALMQKGIVPLFVPPATIRKTVFGKGTIRAEDVWPELADKKHNDFLVALSCALYFYEKGL